jgi:hypothetical protein
MAKTSSWGLIMKLNTCLLFLLAFLTLSCVSDSDYNLEINSNLPRDDKVEILRDAGVCEEYLDLLTSSQGRGSRQDNFEACLGGVYSDYYHFHTDFLNGNATYAFISNSAAAALEACYCPMGGDAIPILAEIKVVDTGPVEPWPDRPDNPPEWPYEDASPHYNDGSPGGSYDDGSTGGSYDDGSTGSSYDDGSTGGSYDDGAFSDPHYDQ